MGLSVSANGGNGLANLFRQGRPAQLSDEGKAPADASPTTIPLRPAGRSGIDSTGSGTAQISAALTVYLSKLAGPDEPGASATITSLPSASAPSSRSSAAELMRTLDAYGSGSQRFSA